MFPESTIGQETGSVNDVAVAPESSGGRFAYFSDNGVGPLTGAEVRVKNNERNCCLVCGRTTFSHSYLRTGRNLGPRPRDGHVLEDGAPVDANRTRSGGSIVLNFRLEVSF